MVKISDPFKPIQIPTSISINLCSTTTYSLQVINYHFLAEVSEVTSIIHHHHHGQKCHLSQTQTIGRPENQSSQLYL